MKANTEVNQISDCFALFVFWFLFKNPFQQRVGEIVFSTVFLSGFFSAIECAQCIHD